MHPVCAVFTGDLIGSRDASADAVESSMTVLKETADMLGDDLDIDLRFSRHRGDGWQILLTRPEALYEAYLAFVSRQQAHDDSLHTKISIGLDTVSHAGTRDLSDASGKAFVASGDMMEHLSTSKGSLRVAISGQGAQTWQMGLLRVSDWMAQNWSTHQSEAVALYLLRRDLRANADRAAALGISRQAYEARFHSSGFPALADAREAFWEHKYETAA
ncbi:MAG: hypothetical protein AAFW87_10175 [Pseudomonadota bacterium]